MRIPETIDDAIWKAIRIFPGLKSFTPEIPEQGGESFTIFFGEKVVQMPRREESIYGFRRQIDILERLQKQDLGIKIPIILNFDDVANVAISERLRGKPLNEFTLQAMTKPEQEELGMQLGTFLRQLHTLNPSNMGRTEYIESRKSYIASILLQLQRPGLAAAAGLEDQDLNNVRWYLRHMDSLPDTISLIHGDLSYRNILYDSQKRRVSVIDFAGARDGYRHEDFLFLGGFPALVQNECLSAYGVSEFKTTHEDLLKLSREVKSICRVIEGGRPVDCQPYIVKDYN